MEESKNPEKLSQVSYVLEEPEYRVFDLKAWRLTSTHPLSVFKNLKVLVLINMKLTWKEVTQIIPAFNLLEELILCRNRLTDYENLFIKDGCLSSLKHLNLENTWNRDFALVQQYFGSLNLENLIVNKNGLRSLCPLTKFQTLRKLSFEGNQFDDFYFLAQLAALPNLTYLNIKHNPIQDRLGREVVRQRAIAEVSTLQWMNGSNLNKLERKDSEIYYLKTSFEDYFRKKNVPHYHYDYDDFLKYAQVEHPKINYLIKKYGVPYENDPTVKEKPKPKSVKTCTINIKALTGKAKDKLVPKKLMLNTGIFPLKQIAGRLAGIPLKQVVVYAQVIPFPP